MSENKTAKTDPSMSQSCKLPQLNNAFLARTPYFHRQFLSLSAYSTADLLHGWDAYSTLCLYVGSIHAGLVHANKDIA